MRQLDTVAALATAILFAAGVANASHLEALGFGTPSPARPFCLWASALLAAAATLYAAHLRRAPPPDASKPVARDAAALSNAVIAVTTMLGLFLSTAGIGDGGSGPSGTSILLTFLAGAAAGQQNFMLWTDAIVGESELAPPRGGQGLSARALNPPRAGAAYRYLLGALHLWLRLSGAPVYLMLAAASPAGFATVGDAARHVLTAGVFLFLAVMSCRRAQQQAFTWGHYREVREGGMGEASAPPLMGLSWDLGCFQSEVWKKNKFSFRAQSLLS